LILQQIQKDKTWDMELFLVFAKVLLGKHYRRTIATSLMERLPVQVAIRRQIFALLHSTSVELLMWTGNKLIRLGKDCFNYHSFQTIIDIGKQIDYNCLAFPLDSNIKNSILNKRTKWENISANNGEYSIYWIYEDYLRHHKEKDDAIVGEQFMNLMLSNWNHSKSIINILTLIGFLNI
jgi:hypothetical protein